MSDAVTSLPDDLRALAASVQMLVLDVDGVLTDGRLYYGADGEALKAFHAQDGLGLRLLRNEDVRVAVVSGRSAPALRRRVADLRIELALFGRDDKRAALDELIEATGVAPGEMAFVGDDVLDMPAMERVGLPIAVADAHPLARRCAKWVTRERGGRGAVREVSDALLEARGRLREAVEHLLGHDVGKGGSIQ